MGVKSRFPLLLAVDDGDFLLRSKLIRSLGIAHLSSSDLRLAHLMHLLLVVIALHLVGAEVVVAAQVLLAVLDFDLELFGGSGGGDLGVEGLASVEGAVELLQAAVFGLSLAFLALRIRDRHRLLLVNILPWTLKRTMAPAKVSWMGRQIRFPTIHFILLENGCYGTTVGAKVTTDPHLLLFINALSHEIVDLIDFSVINAKGIAFILFNVTQILLVLLFPLYLIIVMIQIACGSLWSVFNQI